MTRTELEKELFDLVKRAEDGGLVWDEIKDAIRQEVRYWNHIERKEPSKPYVAPLSPFASTI